jgi:alpha-tubulin suppressor-like RCC1 family protein
MTFFKTVRMTRFIAAGSPRRRIDFRKLVVVFLSFALVAPAFAQSASRTRFLSSPDPSRVGTTVRLTAEVDALGGGAPKGRVSFSDGSVALGTASLSHVGVGQALLSIGFRHVCAVTAASGATCWGSNHWSQIGDNTVYDRRVPRPVSTLSRGVVAITAGDEHSCALMSAGAVECWGKNGYGQVGDGATTTRRTPVAVSGLSSGIVAIGAGRAHSCAVTSGGAVKCWGQNLYGQLGDGTKVSRRPTPVDVSLLESGVVAITAGYWHSCALTGDGAVKCWGRNDNGQLGDGTTTDRLIPVAVSGLSSGVVAISSGGLHNCALTSAGAVKCWGHNDFGQIGDGTKTRRLAPVAVSGLSSDIVAVTAGGAHSCALTKVGAVMCWGRNYYGQLGDGTDTERETPVAVSGLSSGVVAIAAGGEESCALTSVDARCWGSNDYGEIGDGTLSHRATPTLVSGFTPLVRARTRLLTRSLAVGKHLLKATYTGDAAHAPSTGARTHTVVP